MINHTKTSKKKHTKTVGKVPASKKKKPKFLTRNIDRRGFGLESPAGFELQRTARGKGWK